MSVLSDTQILALGSTIIEPFDPARVQPASYDLTLADELLVPKELWSSSENYVPMHARSPRDYIDLREHNPKDYVESCLMSLCGGMYVLKSGKCVLASTAEKIIVPDNLVARVEGKSSLGRLFLSIHSTAGWVDPGWIGKITLEITNSGPWDLVLYTGMRIGQVNFTKLDGKCDRPYGSPGLGSHYQHQRGPAAAAVQEKEHPANCGCRACSGSF